MPDFIRVREGDDLLLSLQVFKATGSVPNLAAASASAPVLKVAIGAGLSVVFSCTSGVGSHRVLRSTNATNASAVSGRFEVSLAAGATSGLTPRVYKMGFLTSVAGKVAEYDAGFLVVQGQVR